MINYLFSAISNDGFNETQGKYLKKDIKNNSKIVFISSIADAHEKNDLKFNNFIENFKKIGITFNSSNLIDNRKKNLEAKTLIDEADIVFLMGGSPILQMNFIKEYSLINEIKNKKIVIGVSAGAINQSNKVVYIDETYEDRVLKYDGLGLVDINIYPHLVWSNVDYLKEVFEVSNYVPITILPNDSFVRIENNDILYVGEHNLVENCKIDLNGHDYIPIKHKGTIFLESERLIYRRTTKDDIDEFFYIQLNPNLRRYLGTTKLGNDLEKNRKYFSESNYDNLDYYRWTIVKKEDNKILGTIYLNIHDEKAKTAGIDYWLREDEWSKGYVTEASKKILEFAFDELDLNRIESCGAKDNKGTLRIMEKIGLKYEGTRKQAMFYYYGGVEDLVMYGLTKEEYLNNKKDLI